MIIHIQLIGICKNLSNTHIVSFDQILKRFTKYIWYNRRSYGGRSGGHKGCCCCDDGGGGLLGGLLGGGDGDIGLLAAAAAAFFALFQAAMMTRRRKRNSDYNFGETFEILNDELLGLNFIWKGRKTFFYFHFNIINFFVDVEFQMSTIVTSKFWFFFHDKNCLINCKKKASVKRADIV